MNTFCSYFNQGICQSCDLLGLEYPDQINLKETILQKSFAKLIQNKLLPTVQSPINNFRNKAKLVVTGTMENPIIGLWGAANLDQGRELLDCPLHLKKINAILPVLKEFILLAKLVPYQIAQKKGELKGVILFHSELTQQSYLRLVVRSKESIDRIKKQTAFLTDQIPGLNCVSVNIQPIAHAVLEGDEEIFMTSGSSIEHQIGSVAVSLGPRAFVQTNQFVAEKLYQTAAEWIKQSRPERFMELFCGQGAFSFFCAPYVQAGLGIEINPDAVAEAKKTAKKYKYYHLNFKSADAGKVKEEIVGFDPDIILVNPPRRGLSETCELLLYVSPKMIIYSSCNYETLLTDIQKLSTNYTLDKIQIFDMFPNTKHFEVLVLLSQNT